MVKAAKKSMTTEEVAAKFDDLAQQEKWFEIQDELFAEGVKSVEPEHSRYFRNAEGKLPVRKKGEDWVSMITAVNELYTSHPVVSGNHFAVGRKFDLVVEGHGRVTVDEVMVYEVKDGRIVLEQFFY